MTRAVLLLLCGAALAGGPSLKDLFDPAEKDFPLRPYTWEDWQNLDHATKLRAKGADAETWEDPPPEPDKEKPKDEDEDEKEKKAHPGAPRYPQDRHPGFRFDDRLAEKQKAFEALMDPAAPSKIEGVLRQLKAIDKPWDRFEKVVAEATEDFTKTKEQLDKQVELQVQLYRKKYGKEPTEGVPVNAALKAQHDRNARRLQELLALEQSERQWQAWLLQRLGGLIAELTEEERAKPLAALAAGLGDRDWQYRVRCAEVAGYVPDDRARAALDDALGREGDPMVLAELIRIRARRGGPELFAVLEARLADGRWPVRAAVIRELSGIRRKESVDLLVARLEVEEGRLRDDLMTALRLLTGQRYGPEPEPWRIWWDKMKAGWTPPPQTPAEAGAPEEQGKGAFVYFYGIRTSSKRIVFCIDLSGSMSFPLDGPNGSRPPRIETARRELFQALGALPEDALFNIVVYSATVSTWKRKMEPATLRNKQAARKFVESREPEGATNIYDALSTALDIAEAGKKGKHRGGDEPEADTIFFLTDGLPTHGRIVDPHQILEGITARNRLLGITIHTVGVSEEQNAAFLLNLAKQNHGDYAAHK